jgi:succinate dehydrogenase hydrophobic anchor subunit
MNKLSFNNYNIFVVIGLIVSIFFFFSDIYLLYSLAFLTIILHIQLSKNEILVDYLHQLNLYLFIKYLLKILTIYNFLLIFLLL